MTTEWVDRLLSGDRRAAARLLSLVEEGGPAARKAVAALYPHTGRAHVIGITGPPGSGKSTLVLGLAGAYRDRERRVGIVAVDPSSPLSGGAVLGDRIRMQELTADSGVFIRSMATRGQLGGLALATADAVKVLDAFGQEVIFVETAGAGQSEVEIATATHSTVVVEAPGLGDEIQAIKAGLLEVADLVVVNKADRDGAELAAATLRRMLPEPVAGGRPFGGDLEGTEAEDQDTDWRVPIMLTVATTGQGVTDLLEALEAHRRHLTETGEWERRVRRNSEDEVRRLLQEALMHRYLGAIENGRWRAVIEEVADRDLDPHSAVERLLGQLEDSG
ncbi:MAG: methylmalonyl Co-A mutase-associated GTPase MeaB [Anaerolineae bacterium]